MKPNWIPVSIIPNDIDEEGFSKTYLITDGQNISTGYYEHEYFAESEEEEIQYSSPVWIDWSSMLLDTRYSGFPEVTHYAEMPELP